MQGEIIQTNDDVKCSSMRKVKYEFLYLELTQAS
jgi:hypothetical protein